jgi:hypothetical protein
MSQAKEQTVSFADFIAERTQDFTGRGWVFEAIHKWLTEGDSRVFLLTGGPGTGKSAIAARLTQLSNGIVTEVNLPGFVKGWLTHHHFCQAGLESTLSPLTFVQSLSEKLANSYPAFRTALEEARLQQIVISTSQEVGTIAAGGQAIGVQVKVEIRGADARPMFDLAVRRPLKALCDESPHERITILLDSLDEALTFNPDSNITQLLKLVNDFPPQVRFVCTCRSNNEQVFDIVGQPTLDLILNAPPNLDDEIRRYAETRLHRVLKAKRTAIATRVSEKSNGNFLYAYHVLNDLVAQGRKVGDPDQLDLPDKLEDVYRKFIERELALNPSRWNDVYRPLLGLIAVARGEGLTRLQLIDITELAEDTAADVLRICAQYLVGVESKDGPYRIYHQSFRDFLLLDRKYGVYPAQRHAAIAHYLQDLCGSNWSRCVDDYALHYAPAHWAEAAALSESKSRRETYTQALIALVSNSKYQRRVETRSGDLRILLEHVLKAVQIAALNEHDGMLLWLVKAAKGFTAFREEYLRAESVATLAEQGKFEQAEQRLPLFGDVDEDWRVAAQLILAWLACARNKSAAQLLSARIAGSLPKREPLPLLRDRLNAALNDTPTFSFEQQDALFLEIGQALVKRISGQDFDRELLSVVNPSLITRLGPQSEMISQRHYAASHDAPILVNIARELGPEGTVLVDEYIEAHAGYNYVVYRNKSLWIVLQAILRHHPDQAWVKTRLRQILVTALSGGGVEFSEMLPLTIITLSEMARDDSHSKLDMYRTTALEGAKTLNASRGTNDSWGNHKRRLTALMELYELLGIDTLKAQSLLDSIGHLPGGFAGFQAPAQLRLLEAVRACRFDMPGLSSQILEQALRSAHHVQDYHFCARITARCNALKRWHKDVLLGNDLAETVHRLLASPHDVEFSADHLVNEAYQYRAVGDIDVLSIAPAQQANTLEQLVEVFQRPAVEFRRLNPTYSLIDKLSEGTPIHIPDPGFAPLLAIHLAARVMADDSLENERVILIRELVPVATNSPTALDTVLSYLLIAAKPEDDELLEELAEEVGPVIFADVAPPLVEIGPS